MKNKEIGEMQRKEYIPTKTFILNGVEFEEITHNINTEFKEIKIPKGWRLWNYIEVIHYMNSKNNLNGKNDFFLEQPLIKNKEKGLCAIAIRFRSSDLSLYLCWSPSSANDGLGVRFCRDIEKFTNIEGYKASSPSQAKQE